MHAAAPRARFWLVELLMVIALIAILVAIAMPHFDVPAARGIDASVQSDLRNALRLEERYQSEQGGFRPFSVAAGGRDEALGFEPSPGVAVTTYIVNGALTIVGSHPSGTSPWCLNAATGRLVAGESC